MATTKDGIWTPDQIDDYNLVTDLSTMASTVQDALEERANAYRGTSTQRSSFTGTAPEGTIWVDTNGGKEVWVKQGNTWQQIWPVVQGSIPGLPYAMAAGMVSFSVSGGIGETNISFPSGRFTRTPVITVTGNSAVSALRNVQIASPTSSGFKLVMQRSTTTATSVNWTAVQMTASSGEG